ncbi:MAG: hypothetical protein A3A80_01605 [Candidatus Terrybacteria bacterium RIFCSPLOWO2_01_FULL_44_24]|uniref:Uncharacterized protein n=1 Tax=Candidatus Terrybacteria bacterium RIFCSPHIGHO2_01_FULL_43_35 TaxID=1802361 RepID=A0A1G2PFI3_9BACT|nr:MAG: hypothetical protein A2828_03980 [Candidatus Terrybacteria bacterium RIFCSPHIGHO2_01_FULL_43_35]OHA49906.1 MAG: hypothetical protein A3B75_03320 [Candidatus Terrybacteria bacterium RIFCSPHIGHO2_02_FULL_43_14]OHA51773.1 MAG: hypothetical protein A3A80_01605 [Candidatus Terrybacteria bacterium RIFCSPLOWO2_01_FULL_44_24]
MEKHIFEYEILNTLPDDNLRPELYSEDGNKIALVNKYDTATGILRLRAVLKHKKYWLLCYWGETEYVGITVAYFDFSNTDRSFSYQNAGALQAYSFEKSFEIMCWKMRLNNLPSWLQEKILYSLESLGLPTPLDNKPPN